MRSTGLGQPHDLGAPGCTPKATDEPQGQIDLNSKREHETQRVITSIGCVADALLSTRAYLKRQNREAEKARKSAVFGSGKGGKGGWARVIQSSLRFS